MSRIGTSIQDLTPRYALPLVRASSLRLRSTSAVRWATLPCEPSSFYLWQDSPNSYWWALGGNETIRVWIVDVGDYAAQTADRLTRLSEIDPLACRERVQRLFSKEAMVAGYEKVFERATSAS